MAVQDYRNHYGVKRQLDGKTCTIEVHAGNVQYASNGKWNNIVPEWTEHNNSFEIDKAPYSAVVTKDYPATITYRRLKHTVTISLKYCEPSVPYLLDANTIRFDNAFGQGIHLEICASKNSLRKEVVIDSLDAISSDTRLRFAYDFKGVKAFDHHANKAFKIIQEDDDECSYFKDTYAWDSARRNTEIDASFDTDADGDLVQEKVIPQSFLDDATYPVRTDAQISYYTGAGDGAVYYWTGTSWNGIHDAATGSGADYTGTTFNVTLEKVSTSSYPGLYRGFLPFNTSALPRFARVSAATLNLYATSVTGTAYFNIVRIDPALSTTTRATGDYDQCQYDANDKDPTLTLATAIQATSSAWNAWTLNSNGRMWITGGGYTMFGIREASYDITGSDPTAGYDIDATFNSSESSNDPYLSITFTVPYYVIDSQANNTCEESNTSVYNTGVTLSCIMFPTGDGYITNCTPYSGTDNYAMVDETPHDQGSTYNSITGITSYGDSSTDLFTYDTFDLYGFGKIDSVKVVIVAAGGWAVTTNNANAKCLLRIGSTTYVGSTEHTLYGGSNGWDYRTYTQTWTTNPSTSAAWSWTELRALQFGYYMKNARNVNWTDFATVTQCYLEVTYKEALLGRTSTNVYYDLGLRFNLEDLSEDATFEFAQLILPASHLDITASDSVDVTIKAEDAATTSDFSSGTRPSQRTATTASVTWNINKSDYFSDEYPAPTAPFALCSPDISGVIEEAISNTNWGTSGNNKYVVLLLDDASGASTQNIIRVPLVYTAGYNEPPFGPQLRLFSSIYDCIILKEMASRVTNTTATISLVSLIPIEFDVEYGVAGSFTTNTTAVSYSSATKGYYVAEHQITGLSANTRYQYRIRYRKPSEGSYVNGDTLYFRTQRNAGTTFSFIITADNHFNTLNKDWLAAYTSGAGEEYIQLADTAISHMKTAQHTNDAADFIIDMGDIYSIRNVKDERTALLNIEQGWKWYRDQKLQNVIAVIGNHEGESEWWTNNFYDHYQTAARNARQTLVSNPNADGGTVETFYKTPNSYESYFAFEWGDALFVVIDPFNYTTSNPDVTTWNWTHGETQYNWLWDTLNNSTKPWKFVFTHQETGGKTTESGGITDGYGHGGTEWAKYSVSSNGPTAEWGGQDSSGTDVFSTQRSSWTNKSRGSIHDILKAQKVTALFHGHDHVYYFQRLDGVLYSAVPTIKGMGPGLMANYDDSTWITAGGYEVGTHVDPHGYLKVTVGPNAVAIQYIGTIRDVDGADQGYALGDVRDSEIIAYDGVGMSEYASYIASVYYSAFDNKSMSEYAICSGVASELKYEGIGTPAEYASVLYVHSTVVFDNVDTSEAYYLERYTDITEDSIGVSDYYVGMGVGYIAHEGISSPAEYASCSGVASVLPFETMSLDEYASFLGVTSELKYDEMLLTEYAAALGVASEVKYDEIGFTEYASAYGVASELQYEEASYTELAEYLSAVFTAQYDEISFTEYVEYTAPTSLSAYDDIGSGDIYYSGTGIFQFDITLELKSDEEGIFTLRDNLADKFDSTGTAEYQDIFISYALDVAFDNIGQEEYSELSNTYYIYDELHADDVAILNAPTDVIAYDEYAITEYALTSYGYPAPYEAFGISEDIATATGIIYDEAIVARSEYVELAHVILSYEDISTDDFTSIYFPELYIYDDIAVTEDAAYDVPGQSVLAYDNIGIEEPAFLDITGIYYDEMSVADYADMLGHSDLTAYDQTGNSEYVDLLTANYVESHDDLEIFETYYTDVTSMVYDEAQILSEDYATAHGYIAYEEIASPSDEYTSDTATLHFEEIGIAEYASTSTGETTYGSFCWGHDTNVEEQQWTDLSNGSGTATLESTGDTELVGFNSGDTWTLNTVYTGVITSAYIQLNKYVPGDTSGLTVRYRTGDSKVNCESSGWSVWNGTHFDSLGYVQLSFEAS